MIRKKALCAFEASDDSDDETYVYEEEQSDYNSEESEEEGSEGGSEGGSEDVGDVTDSDVDVGGEIARDEGEAKGGEEEGNEQDWAQAPVDDGDGYNEVDKEFEVERDELDKGESIQRLRKVIFDTRSTSGHIR